MTVKIIDIINKREYAIIEGEYIWAECRTKELGDIYIWGGSFNIGDFVEIIISTMDYSTMDYRTIDYRFVKLVTCENFNWKEFGF